MDNNEKNNEIIIEQETEVILTDENASFNEDAVTEINSTEEKKKPKQGFHFTLYDIVSTVMSSFIIIAVIFTFLFRLVGVSGLSMTNTLQDRDWLITVQKNEYVRGDIVVITQPNYFNEPLIKRVIATEGETVDIDYSTATVYVDGVALVEPYVKESFILPKSDDIDFPYTVPEGCLFCMGDNRNGSTDSRSTYIDPIDERYILGKAVLRILPFGDFDIYDYE